MLDTESTDCNDRLIEIALVRSNSEVLLDTLVNPGDSVITEAAAAETVHRPDVPTFAELYNDLVELLTGARAICWNSDFDCGLLAFEADLLLPHYSNAAETEWVLARWEDSMAYHAAWVGDTRITGDGSDRTG